MAKRVFDLFGSILGLALLMPLFLFVAVAIKAESAGPVFFRQERVGIRGKAFRIHKFRTMFAGAEDAGRLITIGADPRITRVGSVLRKYKLDELPQLINVLRGEMSLVGPRPEVPQYVAFYPEELRALILSVRPGITDRASIRFRNESDILAGAQNPIRAYVEEILPIKQRYYAQYAKSHTFWDDLSIIFETIRVIVWR